MIWQNLKDMYQEYEALKVLAKRLEERVSVLEDLLEESKTR